VKTKKKKTNMKEVDEKHGDHCSEHCFSVELAWLF
jgi:hypothetical protein